MTQLDYEALRATPVAEDPFRHVVVSGFLPPAALREVVADLPAMHRGGSFPIASLRLGPAARALMGELEGPAFREAVAEKFGLDLKAAPTMVTLRGQARAKDGRIHCDSIAKRVTVLLYLNPDTAAWARQEGCLRLLRGPGDIEDYVVEVPPVNGTLLIFPNGPTTWHGHNRFVGQRYVVQLNYMTADAAARSELRRHRISAFFKTCRFRHAAQRSGEASDRGFVFKTPKALVRLACFIAL
jgi:SM-20-related protein